MCEKIGPLIFEFSQFKSHEFEHGGQFVAEWMLWPRLRSRRVSLRGQCLSSCMRVA